MTNDGVREAQDREAGYAEAEQMLRDLITPDLISGTAIRVARDHMMQFARRRAALSGSGVDQVGGDYVPRSSIPRDCDGIEQEAFEAWASKGGFDMATHPLHWLFLDKETAIARKAWKACLAHVAERAALSGVDQPTDAPKAGGDNYAAWQQKRGRAADLIDWAISEYDGWMADDHFDARVPLDRIINRFRENRPVLTPAPSVGVDQPTSGAEVERLREKWKGDTYIAINEERNSGADDYAKGFNNGLAKARGIAFVRIDDLLASLSMSEPTSGAEVRELLRQAMNALGTCNARNDPMETIADNGMTVWDGMCMESERLWKHYRASPMSEDASGGEG